ncbi:MAG: SCP2 sterol-binding domain-containing protein [Chromatiaceae bacterium]|nr:SCP2 sterol-binding domain-containing protein [Chromatiaceae bacterium]
MSEDGIQIPDALLAVLEQGINAYVALDPEGAEAFAALTGRIVRIEIKGFGTCVTLIPGVRGLQLFGHYEAAPDCIIRATPLGLARLGVLERKEEPLIEGEVEIEGDVALAQDFSAALAGLRIDWEEQLARLIGDPFARQLGERVREARHWGERSSETLVADVREYLQEERRLVPTRYEIAAFLERVDVLRDDAERLGVRIERLRERLAEAGGAR